MMKKSSATAFLENSGLLFTNLKQLVNTFRNNHLFIQRLMYFFLLVVFIFPEEAKAAITDIADMKGLTAQVKTEIQGSVLNLILNAAGVATAMVALITSRWTTLLFGIAYLVFVNGYFGYINGAFK